MTPNRFVEDVFVEDVYVMVAYCWSRWLTRLFFFWLDVCTTALQIFSLCLAQFS